MPIHFYDPDEGRWKTVDNPSCADIAEILIASANNRACAVCDADCSYEWPDGGGPPHITVVHEDDCPAA